MSATARPLRSVETSIAEAVEEAVARALQPVLAELERLRGREAAELVPLPEAARRLGRSLRTLQRQAKNGGLEVEWVAGVRMVRLPPGVRPR